MPPRPALPDLSLARVISIRRCTRFPQEHTLLTRNYVCSRRNRVQWRGRRGPDGGAKGAGSGAGARERRRGVRGAGARGRGTRPGDPRLRALASQCPSAPVPLAQWAQCPSGLGAGRAGAVRPSALTAGRGSRFHNLSPRMWITHSLISRNVHNLSTPACGEPSCEQEVCKPLEHGFVNYIFVIRNRCSSRFHFP